MHNLVIKSVDRGSGICLMETTTYIYETREHIANSTAIQRSQIPVTTFQSHVNVQVWHLLPACKLLPFNWNPPMTNSPLQAAPVSPYKHALHIPNNVYIHTKPIIVITIPLTESVLLNMDGICYPSNEPVLMRFFPFYATHNSHTSKRTRILSSEVTQVITQIW